MTFFNIVRTSLAGGSRSGLLAAAAAALVAPEPPICDADPPGWTLAWEDDFLTFDESRWTKVDTNIPTNNSLQDYLPDQVTTGRGLLTITAEDRPSRGLPYRSGQVIAKPEQRLGRWEVRARLPTSRGNWPAIWLLPDVDRYPWPRGGEIDILENRGNEPNITSSAFHYGTNPPFSHSFVYQEQRTAAGGGLVDYHQGFHTYAVDWTERYLRFYVDGVHHFTVHDKDVDGFLSRSAVPMQLVINNAIGGTFLPDPDSTSVWPQRFDVDWVRVYEHDPASFAASFTNGGFEAGDAGGALAGWSVFGASSSGVVNVRGADEAVAAGDSSLKLFGDFGRGETFSGVSQGVTVTDGARVTASLEALVRSQDSIAGTDNSALLKIEFYDEFGAKHGGDHLLVEEQTVVASGETVEDEWRRHELSATAPEGAVEARLSVVFRQPRLAAGAVHIDNVRLLAAAPAAATGDFNGDGWVDAADYTVWRESLGFAGTLLPADANGDGSVTAIDYGVWRDAYRAGSPAGGAEPASAVPAPASGAVSLAALTTLLAPRSTFLSRPLDPR